MSNIYSVFDRFIQAINLQGSAPCSIIKIPIGEYFEKDSLLKRFDRIIDEKLLVNDFSHLTVRKNADEISSLARELSDCLTLTTRLETFILIYNKLYNSQTNNLIASFKPLINKVAKLLSIDRYTLEAIEIFYKNQFFSDHIDSLYVVGPGLNPLWFANGARVSFTGTENVITYFKLLPNFNFFITKTISVINRYDKLGNEFEVSSVNIINSNNFDKIECDFSYSDLLSKISTPVQANSIEIKQKESFPYINLDAVNGKVRIEGVSTPISPLTYLDPILDWIDLYCLTNSGLEINLAFLYYNTYTTKFLVKLINKCNSLNGKGSEIVIKWNYSRYDDELKECGEFYKGLFYNKPEFKMVTI